MAKQLPKAPEENTGEWLNTYADMVTLLLTFFVLLFACSNMDETKIQYIMQAFQNHGRYVNTFVAKPNTDPSNTNEIGTSETQPTHNGGEGEMPQSFDVLYQYLGELINSENLSDVVSIESGAAHITISFKDSVMFKPDSAILTAEGRNLIAKFSPIIRELNGSIQSFTVSGHTAVSPGSTLDDFGLSANRAVSVQNLLSFLHTVDDSKYVVAGYGPNRPAKPNDTPEGRAANRRVEFVLLKAENESDLTNKDVMMDYLRSMGISNEMIDALFPKTDPETLPDGAAEKIEAFIKDKFDNVGVPAGGYGPGTADGSEFFVEETTTSS